MKFGHFDDEAREYVITTPQVLEIRLKKSWDPR